ncbi:hypothetical protein GGU10DRAFT_436194 [Lentinula aff. detonsa]|uniref:BHLH domain-containing protein n=1 Tax=Lentinula aff. detonsa TaxID=2804958 RepID=A0AA38NP51_9AGAR|nr:hypothetical protein GGU10DRAFT_436194 [Lentinula aff. detonsa]
MSNTSPAAVVYNASVNPARRVKVTRMTERTILPKQTGASDNVDSVVPLSVAGRTPPTASAAKRGRKPASNASGLSRTAREAQRKLNHSVIEKARRTKINEALTELARLGTTVEALQIGGTLQDAEACGPDLGTSAEKATLEPEHDDDDDAVIDNDDDKDGDYGAPSSIRTRSGASKSESLNSKDHDTTSKAKDKFKLDILIKTVENMQFLFERVRRLEAELKDAKSSSHRPIGSEDFERRECVERTLVNLPSTSTLITNKRKRHPSADFHANSDEFFEDSFSGLQDHIQPPNQRRRKVMQDTRGQERNEHLIEKGPALPSLPSISSWLLDHNPSAASVYSSRETLPSFAACSSSSSPGLISSLPIPSALQRRQRFPADAHSPSVSYLPSPPSSTRFPVPALASSNGVPALELGPSSVSARAASPVFKRRSGSNFSISTNLPDSSVISSVSRDISTTATTSRTDTALVVRTPEEESAASLLLHMKSSPPVFMTARTRKDSILERIEPLPLSRSSSISPKMSKSLSKAPNTSVVTHSDSNAKSVMIAQTPSSILGLDAKSS